MALEPSLEEQQLLADTLAREGSQMTRRELIAGALAGGGFVVAVGLLCWLRPPGSFDVSPVLVCALVMVLATRAPIDTPFGFTVPTQLAFVPLLFAMPAVLVPAAVMVTLALARLPEVIRGQVPSSRLLQAAPELLVRRRSRIGLCAGKHGTGPGRCVASAGGARSAVLGGLHCIEPALHDRQRSRSCIAAS